MSVVFAQAPLRLSLGGGGTDLPSYYERFDGYVVAAALNKHVHIILQPSFDGQWRLKYSQTEVVPSLADVKHPLFREILSRHWTGEPLEIATAADVPAGTGLGSSAAFSVALLKALAYARKVPTMPLDLAKDACEIEMGVLCERCGKQDPHVSACGGICAYEFYRDEVSVEPLAVPSRMLAKMREHLLLFYTGKTRSSSDLLRDQDERTIADDGKMLDDLHLVKRRAHEIRDHLLQGTFHTFAEMLHEHWVHKRDRSPGMTSERIDDLYELARENGVIGGKLVGAGGGGFLLLASRDPVATRQAMNTARVPELVFDFDYTGATAFNT